MLDTDSLNYPRKLWLVGKDENQVIAVEAGAIIVGNVDKHRVDEVKKAFQAGTSAISLTKDAYHIPIQTLNHIRASQRQPVIQVNWEVDKTKDLYHETQCRDHEQCQEVMEALHALPHPAWSRETLPNPLLQRVYIPIIGMIIAALVSWGLWALSHEPPQADARPVHVRTNWIGMLILGALRFLGPKMTMILGFLFIMGFAVWLLVVLHAPTLYDTLTPDKESPDTDE